MKRAALYLRVSTKEQTTQNQRIELERVAEAKGWRIVSVFEDDGISGAKGRDKRPSFDHALKDAVRAKLDVLMAWDVSRLGRSLAGLVQTLDDLHANGVDLYLHQQAIDTTTPSGKAMFQMCGVFAEFERSMISERVRAGLSRAASNGTKLGRPIAVANLKEIQREREEGKSIRRIAANHALSVGTVHRLLKTISG
ncbi:recombinase family protein [Nitratireductor thuwali]|uniref:DNA-invertase from lambdoid prophage Rac n=1 Tax=Nitratireductor thuwali TaxID=2267699 RepID=A0ABY5MQN1_9HYPH|nr:Putative DNA-invertase from lambdoid prophage Rac [Nitratireductor thuwali]